MKATQRTSGDPFCREVLSKKNLQSVEGTKFIHMRRANRTLNRVKSPEGLAAVRRWMLAHAGPYSEQGGAATIKPHSANLKCTGVETFELW